MENHETYLADWFEDRLTDEELQQIISTEAFLHYKKIKDALSGYALETPEVESHFQLLKDKLQQPPQIKRRVIPLWKSISVAASVLILIALSFYFSTGNAVTTKAGKVQTVLLADNSRVRLGAASTLKYSNFFKFSRNLSLKGEAYFEVEKGSKFTVNTAHGSVTVLGTKFRVIAFDSYFEVHCDEGKVRVDSADKSIELTPGKSVAFYQDKVTEWNQEIRLWHEGAGNESSFFKTPVEAVFEKIENEYGLKINYPENIKGMSFTGAVSTVDIDKAMKSVCLPFHLKYKSITAGEIEVTNE